MSTDMDSLLKDFLLAPANQARQVVRQRNYRLRHDDLRKSVKCMERRRFLKALLRPFLALRGGRG